LSAYPAVEIRIWEFCKSSINKTMDRNRIIQKNKLLKSKNKKALVAYITSGFPDIKATEKLVEILALNGADFIELGFPFSDPVADGPTIQKASALSLKKGMCWSKFFNLISRLRKKTDIPLILMSYCNPIFQLGVAKFAKKAARSGLDGVIVPDLPPEESELLYQSLKRKKICQIFLVSPVTQEKRIKTISRLSSGFIYYVSLTGVTGQRKKLPADVNTHVRKIKKQSKLPVFVGFGISTPKQAENMLKAADGIIIGSAIMNIILKNSKKTNYCKKITAFIRSIKRVFR